MTKKCLFLIVFGVLSSFIFSQAPQIIPGNHPGLSGLWEFENTGNLTTATTGTALVLTGSQTSVSGPEVSDNAIRIGSGSYLTCYHNIAGNGGGTEVNEYSMVFDFKVSSISQWHSFYQANSGNSNDAELFINTSGQIGRSTSGPGYSSYTVVPNEWYRMVVSVDLGNYYRVYLDGALILAGGSLSVDGDYSLYPSSGSNLVHFFADNDGEDNEIDIAVAAIFDHPLNQTEVNSLGGYGHNIDPIPVGILPYLQTPTPTSIYVSWHSTQTSSTIIDYGTSSSLGLTQTGAVDDISGKKWHTAKLTGLSPDTEYFYRCTSGSEISEIYSLKTPSQTPQSGQHLRYIIVGDSRTDVARTTQICNAAKNKAVAMFGSPISDYINLVVHVGDIVTSGGTISQYENEYFRPYSSLSANIPFMVIIGNHENESQNFYDYMKYEDISDYSFPLSEKFYNFYYLNNQFIFINGNGTYSNSIQTSWLESKLTQSDANPDVDMVFCFTHQPGHSELWPDGNTPYIQDDVIPVLQQYDKVQLLGYGHSHNYERGTVESKAAVTNGDFYVMLTGGAGSALDRWGMYPNQQDYDEITIALDHYLYNIVDVDIDNRSFELWTYSLGNTDKPLDNVLIDYYYRKLDQPNPDKPIAMSPIFESGLQPLLVASQFEGVDSCMSSKFQITATPGDYSAPIFEKRQDWVNIFGDTGAPDYEPIDLNEGIDLRRLQLTTNLTDAQQYAWRVAYRDHNQKWSEWSDEQIFTTNSSLSAYTEFSADITTGPAPLAISFTDLSYPAVSGWTWDFDNNGSIDSDVQDPNFIFTEPGFYTVKLTTANGVEIKDLYINVEDNTVEVIENKSNDILRINPNPCSTYTNIEYYLKESEKVKITVLDTQGKTVSVLVDEVENFGKHNLSWEPKTNEGSRISAGNYFIRFEHNGKTETKKVVVTEK
jgi:PKD repeat protein